MIISKLTGSEFLCFAFLLSVFLVGHLTVSGQSNFLITGNSAGNIRIGMTVAEAKRAMPRHQFARISDGEGIALIRVARRNQTHMTIYAGEFDPGQPINNNGRIEFIEVWNSQYRTSAGVYPQMRVSDAERRYGRVQSIMLSEIEAREFVRFSSQPAGVDFRIQNRRGMAGVYPSGQTVTSTYSPTAYIASVIVLGGAGSSDTGNPAGGNETATKFTSRYTDLRTQCQTPRNQGNQGGHISTYCQGYGGYQIHIFDTATTMEINLQSKDRQNSIHLASQSLSFDRNNVKIEWRMQDGKPFAVIMRAYKYQLGNDGLIRYPEVRTGEYLIVQGLEGYERINYEVNAQTVSKANERARQMADAAYSGDNTGSSSNASFQNVNINRYNRLIEIGVSNRQAWVKSPMQVVARLVGDVQEIKTRTVRFVKPSAEGSDSLTVVVIDDGLLDDSVRSERLRLQLRRDRDGVWKVLSGRRSWRCQQGRGHQTFSAVPCN